MNTPLNTSFLQRFRSAALVCLILGSVIAAGSYAAFPTQVLMQTPTFPENKTVIEMTADELREYYGSDLRHLEFSSSQDDVDALLTRIGERVQELFSDFADTSSKESVILQKLGYSGKVDRSDILEFNYLLIYHPSKASPFLEEYRTDRKYNQIAQDVIRGFFITSGYACIGLNFHPACQKAARVSGIWGKQTAGARTLILAFAQKLDQAGLLIRYTDTDSGMTVQLPVQGIAWMDPKTYQILRLRINLISAGNQSSLTEQTTDIRFSNVRFDNAEKRLWLPLEITVTTTTGGFVFRNYHKYSGHKLFAVASDYKVDKPKTRK